MMKRRIVSGIIAAFALLFVLPGCSDPLSISEITVPLNSLSGPENFQAVAYEGMNLLTWNPVTDAAGYEIWRKDPSTGYETRLDRTNYQASDTYYKDFVGYHNELVNGQSYEYTVIALSSMSTSTSNGQASAVQNGVSKVSVTANIPAEDAFTVTAPADADITTVLVASSSANVANKDRLIVTIANTKPNYSYGIAYTYGKNTINRSFESISEEGDWSLGAGGNNKLVTAFPIVGGDNSITVTAYFGGFDDGYYNKAEAVSKTVTASSVPIIDEPPAYSSPSATRDANSVILTWGDFTGADTYDVYKVETSSYTASLNNSNVTVIGDWVKLTGTPVYDPVSDPAKWSLVDAVTDGKGYFIYALIASNSVSGAKSSPYLVGNISPTIVNVPTISVTTYETGTPPASKNAQVTWNTTPGQTYKLEYAEVKSSQPNTNADNSDYIVVGSYTDAAITEADHYPQGRGVVQFETLPTGKNYIFRLSATENGITSTEAQMEYAFLTGGLFSVTHSAYISLSYVSRTVGTETVYDVSVTMRSNSKDSTLTLYRRKADTPESVFTKVELGAKAEADANTTVIFSDNGLTGGNYEYKLVTSLGAEDTDEVYCY